MARLEIRLLGDTKVDWVTDGASPMGGGVRLGPQGEMLLAFLVLHHQSSHRREFLAEMLWPETEATSARLSTALWRLKAALAVPAGSPPVLDEAKGTVAVSPDASVLFAEGKFPKRSDGGLEPLFQ